VIGERLGRLPAALRESLQIASVEGEEFTAEVVAQVQGIEARKSVRQLSGILVQQHRLIRGQGSRQLGSSGQRLSRYRFRHILFQKFLYDSLDDTERVYLHEAVGTTLERLYGEQPGEVALELARHFEAAGLTRQAIDNLRRAGERAERLSANEEALAHFKRALALLDTLPDTPARVEQELTLQLALGRVSMSAKGYAAPEVEKAYLRARALCQETHVEDSRQFFESLSGLCGVYYIRAQYQRGRELAEQLLALAQRAQKPIRLLWARFLLGENLFRMGELLLARTQVEFDLAFYDPMRRVGRAHHAVQDPAVSILGCAALVLWLLGYPDQALKKQQEALALARQLNHPFSLATALGFGLRLAALRRDTQLVLAQVEATITLSTEHGFPFWQAWATILQGWARVERCPAQGGALAPPSGGGSIEGQNPATLEEGRTEGQEQAEAGITQMRQGLVAYLATGAEAARPEFLFLLAGAYRRVRQVEEGLNVLTEALVVVNRTGEHVYEAEIHRLKGELLLQVEARAEAEASFWRAIEVARRLQARWWELRATVSLARLWHSPPSVSPEKRDEARQLLAEIYNWFTEGFDTVDLKEAKALLEELS
jgi:predicted ATPase